MSAATPEPARRTQIEHHATRQSNDEASPTIASAREHIARTTRAAHFAVAVTVMMQLASGSVMVPPLVDRGTGDIWFATHTLLGVAAAGAVTLLWITVLAISHGEEKLPNALCPWFSAQRRAAVAHDLVCLVRRLRARRLPRSVDTTRALAPALHGLGLLAVTSVVATGALGWYAGLQPLLAIHAALVTLLWIYLCGHTGFALLHEVAGDGRLGHMFLFLPWRRVQKSGGNGR
ncbi:cytochrome b/b6 domain-containing protein [Dankookia rubra]|uniref:cytochrome b/b6 domain-containing protein n=1 Tax=Dankookia rubra TaxID=1442381 RepID=UPI00140AC9A1|nr:cytochrome b/b6 domain-containing protein [Dankookia rubra]